MHPSTCNHDLALPLDTFQLERCKVSIISYDFVCKLKDTLGQVPHFSIVVCDEAHYLKTHTSNRCKASLPILQGARRAVLLTGTPALSGPSELITLMQVWHN